MSNHRVHHFLAVVDAGSFRRAANALGTSQPALSKGVRALEKELGAQLLHREPRAVTPTEFGMRVVAYARRVADAEDDLAREFAAIEGLDAGNLQVALGPYPSVVSGYAAAAQLTWQHPNLRIGLCVASWHAVTNAVANREADVGIAELADASENPSIVSEPLGAHKARFFCRPGHPILDRKSVALAGLLQYPWVSTRIPARIARSFPQQAVRAGRFDDATGEFVPAVNLDVPMQLAAFVGDGDALAIGSFTMVEQEMRAGRLATVANTRLEMRADYGFIWRRHRSLPRAAVAYVRAVRDQERSFVEREARLAATFERRRRPARKR